MHVVCTRGGGGWNVKSVAMMHRRNETARWQVSLPSSSNFLPPSLSRCTPSAAISNDVSGRFARSVCLINHGLPLLPATMRLEEYEKPIESADFPDTEISRAKCRNSMSMIY